MSDQKCDILIVGGGVIGSAAAYFLSRDCSPETRICVVERDTSYAQSSTALCAASIRVQFSNPINVDMSLFGGQFIRTFESLFSENAASRRLGFRENGYLFLAGNKQQCQVLRQNHTAQIAQGADVILLEQGSLSSRFHYLNVEDISLASLGQSGEGWFDNMGILAGLKSLAQENGVEYLNDEVVALEVVKNRVISASLASGKMLRTGEIVNAAGARASQIAAMAGIELPVEPRKRTTFVLQTPELPPPDAPLIVDHQGFYIRPEGDFWICAMQPENDPAVNFDDFEPRHHEFEDYIWPRLARRSQLFEAVKVRRQWAGHYAYNTLDQNAIVGRHPIVQNLLFANGFSGHGLQQAPAVGRAISELVLFGRFKTLDLSALGFERVILRAPFFESNIV